MNSTTVTSTNGTQVLQTSPVLLEYQPNEIAVYLGDGGAVYIFINGFKYSVNLAIQDNNKSLRYVSFAGTNSYYMDPQEYFYNCAIHSQETSNMEKWDRKDIQSV